MTFSWPRHLHDVEGADHIAIEIGPGVLERVAHTGLRREMDDHLGREVFGDARQQGLVLQQALGCREMRMLQQHLVATPLQADVVVVRHPVVAMDLEALGQQQLRQMIADEARRPGDEHAAHAQRPTAS